MYTSSDGNVWVVVMVTSGWAHINITNYHNRNNSRRNTIYFAIYKSRQS